MSNGSAPMMCQVACRRVPRKAARRRWSSTTTSTAATSATGCTTTSNTSSCSRQARLFKPRLVVNYPIWFQLELADFTGMAWATVFEEKATQMLGMNAQQLGEIQKADVRCITEMSNLQGNISAHRVRRDLPEDPLPHVLLPHPHQVRDVQRMLSARHSS